MHGDADISVETIAPDDVSAVTHHRAVATITCRISVASLLRLRYSELFFS
jgi:hypothetical protein